MNYHYIECMIKERRKEELERCNRMRLLKQAGYSHKGSKEQMLVAISRKLSFWNSWGRLMDRSFIRLFSHGISPRNQRGKCA